MTDKSVERVREDLEVMRQALGLRHPYEREHVWSCLALAAVGVVVAAITMGTNVAATPVIQGSIAHWSYIGLLVVPAFLCMGVMAEIARRRREVAPLFWREWRQSSTLAAIAAPVYIGFTIWALKTGLSASTLTAGTLFVMGFVSLLNGIADRTRRCTLGYAISTMAAGAVAPWARYESAGLLAGGWLILGGLSTAVILAWQLRNRSEHGLE